MYTYVHLCIQFIANVYNHVYNATGCIHVYNDVITLAIIFDFTDDKHTATSWVTSSPAGIT